VDERFYWGFCDFHRIFVWFFVAILWWLSAKTWFFDRAFLVTEIRHDFKIYFLAQRRHTPGLKPPF
jgi:hypothetical protein